MRRLRAQLGDMLRRWLPRAVLTGFVLAEVVHETDAIVHAHLDTDDTAGELARAGAVAYRASGPLAPAEEAAEDVACVMTRP